MFPYFKPLECRVIYTGPAALEIKLSLDFCVYEVNVFMASKRKKIMLYSTSTTQDLTHA